MSYIRSAVFVGLVAALAPTPVIAQPLQGNLTVQQASSSITAGGTVAGFSVAQQGAGSLITNYTGAVGIGALDLTGLQLSFSASTNLVAGNSGSWQPMPGGAAGFAPANYGGLIDLGIFGAVRFAVRDLTATISTHTPITLTPTGGGNYSFPTNQSLTLLAPSVVDYLGTGALGGMVGSGSESLAGETATNAGANGTLTDLGGGNFSLIYPVSLIINDEVGGQPATITLNGSLTAQGTLTPVPEPTSIVGVSALTLAVVGVWRRRRSARQAEQQKTN